MERAGGSEERGSHRWRPLEKSWSSHLERKTEIIQAGLTGVRSQAILGGLALPLQVSVLPVSSKREPAPKTAPGKWGDLSINGCC